MIPFKDDKAGEECYQERRFETHDMGLKTLGIYLYLYLFLLDFFTYLPFIDVSFNLWLDLFPLNVYRKAYRNQ